jgi:uncharacterized membrane protein YgaE (UPF0421/DUF939 family)
MTTQIQTKPNSRAMVTVTKYSYATAVGATLALLLTHVLHQPIPARNVAIVAVIWAFSVLVTYITAKTRKR